MIFDDKIFLFSPRIFSKEVKKDQSYSFSIFSNFNLTLSNVIEILNLIVINIIKSY